MAEVRLEIEAPASEWYVQLSTEHPADVLNLLTLYDEGSRLLGVFEVETTDLDDLQGTLDEISSIIDYEVIHTDEGFAVIKYIVTESLVYSATVASGILPPASVRVQDGVMSVEIKMPHNQLSDAVTAIEAVGGSCELLSVSGTGGAAGLLTDGQHQFVTEAVRHGYYDTPRRCTLSELAALLDVSPAAASTMAHRAEERIVKEFVQRADGSLPSE
ncbi:helix-turn-helix domain-containing protein [Halosolutus gelatinilyticus]|uniref:helix-turn-helix domain-containing protein n=1 Tax=Halosolutus gelatinilyticus TaxID=2931975 RepID=UPI001FF0F3C7|nr:helix-turn-helix domain-containing protein [Halosolutus gelatinilyticus]